MAGVEGRVAMITGGGRGIGRATAETGALSTRAPLLAWSLRMLEVPIPL